MENKNLEKLKELKDKIEEVKVIDNDEVKSISRSQLTDEFDYFEVRLYKGLKKYIDDTYNPISKRLTRIETKQHELGDKVDRLVKTLSIDKKQEEIAEYLGKLKELLGDGEK